MQNNDILVKFIQLGFDSLQGIFDGISNGIIITDKLSTILYINSGYTRITGFESKDVIGENPGILHSGLHNKDFYEAMWKSISETGRWAGEIWNRHKQGHLIPEFLTITKIDNNKQLFYIGVFSDISVLVEKNQKKLDLALTDPLTRLHNRSYLKEAVKFILNQYNRADHDNDKYNVALMFIDVNKFKHINDTYGHLAGDKVLRYIADAIKDNIRSTDVAVRYGGDEFIIVLDRITNKGDIKETCMRINEKLKAPLTYEGHQLFTKINIGISFFPKEAVNLEKLISNADQAMYFAKQHQQLLSFYNENH